MGVNMLFKPLDGQLVVSQQGRAPRTILVSDWPLWCQLFTDIDGEPAPHYLGVRRSGAAYLVYGARIAQLGARLDHYSVSVSRQEAQHDILVLGSVLGRPRVAERLLEIFNQTEISPE